MSFIYFLFQDPIWRQTGRDLQILADQFARSHERLLVRQLAEEVDFATLDKQKFIAMLSELFKVILNKQQHSNLHA